MKFTFETENINPRLYQRAIRYYLWETLGITKYVSFTTNWKIKFRPSEQAVNDPFFHGQKGIGGVTGIDEIVVYVHDVDDNSDLLPYYRMNMVVITHELCHAMLIHNGQMHRTVLRNDDYSGHRKGSFLNFSTAEVHDRHTENNFWTMDCNFWDWKTFKNKRLTCKVLEIRDIIELL